ncbi:MAG: YccF domain-containing protein [Coriobacteriales bacterium]|nr:YccF domain-containing protein [Coriobacteriales bacterium]
MRTIGNIIWILCGGIITAIGWALAGILFYITIIGIPLGRQAFKMASLTLAPFGKTIVYGGGAPSLVANIVWVIVIGFWEALAYAMAGALFCLTVVGIPFGLQLFKMAKLSFMPFGAQVFSVA